MKKITCCKDCTERQTGCHSRCEKYLAEKKTLERDKEERRVKMVSIYYTRETATRLMKHKHSLKRK